MQNTNTLYLTPPKRNWLYLGNWVKSIANSSSLVLADLLSAGFTLWLLNTYFGIYEHAPNHTASLIFTLLTALAVLLFLARGHYHKRTPFWDETRDTAKVLISLGLFQGTLSALLTPNSVSSFFIFAWMFNIFLFIGNRTVAKLLLLKVGLWQRPTVIIGDGENAVETAKAILEEKLLGYEIIAFLSSYETNSSSINIYGKEIAIKQFNNNPEKFLRRLGSPHIIVALERGGLNEMQMYLNLLSLRYSQISIVPALKGLPLFETDYNHFFSHEVLMLNLKNNLTKPTSRILKRIFDLAGALSLIIILSPLFLLLAILIRKSGKPVFFGHTRIGRNGRPFKCYKFRTMVSNAQQVLEELLESDPLARKEWERDFKLKNDPRITLFGHFLRRTSLDELPQLWNVLKGDMSLVGPRPVIKDELERYGDQATFYYRAKPGITGLWQVSGRNNIDYDARVHLDVWYVRNWSLWNDIIILIRTVSAVLARKGAY